MNSLKASALCGHDIANLAYQEKLDAYGARCIARDLQIGTNTHDALSEIRKWNETASKKNVDDVTFIFQIEEKSDPREIHISSCEKKVFRPFPQLTKPVTGLKTPCVPLYRFNCLVSTTLNSKYFYVQKYRTLPNTELNAAHVYWLLCFSTYIEEKVFKEKIYAASVPFNIVKCLPKFWQKNLKTVAAPYNYSVPTGADLSFIVDEHLAYYTAFVYLHNILCQIEIAALGEQQRELLNESSDAAEWLKKQDPNKLASIRFARHPEVIRFYGGTAINDLQYYYDLNWLLGLKLEDIYLLHHRLHHSLNDLFCIPPETLMLSSSHIYQEDSVASIQQPLTSEVLSFHARKTGKLDKECVEAAFLCTLCDECGNKNKHRFITLKRLFEITEKKWSMYFDQWNALDVLDVMISLLEKHCIVLIQCTIKNGKKKYRKLTAEALENKASVSKWMDIHVYLYDIYMEDGLILLSMYRLFTHRLANQSIVPDYDRIYEPPGYLCSEQILSLLKMMCYPMLNLNGAGGAGKTEILKQIGSIFGHRNVLHIGFMGAHVGTLRERVRKKLVDSDLSPSIGRFLTAHRLFHLHRFACGKTFPALVEEIGAEKAHSKCHEIKDKLLSALLKSVQYDSEYYRNLLSMYDFPHTSCMLENVKVIVVEEMSVFFHKLFGQFLWMWLRCAKDPQCVVTAGDVFQIQSLQTGTLYKEITIAMPETMIEYYHNHRFETKGLHNNACAIRNKEPEDLVFDQKQSCIFECDISSVESTILRVIDEYNLDFSTTHFVTYTNAIRNQLVSKITERMLKKTKNPPKSYNSFAYYRGETVIPKLNAHGANTNQLLEVVCVAWVTAHQIESKESPSGVAMNPNVEHWNIEQLVDVAKQNTIYQTDMPKHVQAEMAIHKAFYRTRAQCESMPEHELFKLLSSFATREKVIFEWQNKTNQRMFLPMEDSAKKFVYDSMYPYSTTDVSNIMMEVIQVEPSTAERAFDSETSFPILVCKNKTTITQKERNSPDFEYPSKIFPSEGLVYLPYSTNNNRIQHGAITTGHAMQGNQASTVVIVQPTDFRCITNSWIYTMFTRPMDRLIVLMKQDILQRMIMRDDPLRMSSLPRSLSSIWANYKNKFLSPGEKLLACSALEALESIANKHPSNNQCLETYNAYLDTKDEEIEEEDLYEIVEGVYKQKKGKFEAVKWKIIEEALSLTDLPNSLLAGDNEQIITTEPIKHTPSQSNIKKTVEHVVPPPNINLTNYPDLTFYKPPINHSTFNSSDYDLNI